MSALANFFFLWKGWRVSICMLALSNHSDNRHTVEHMMSTTHFTPSKPFGLSHSYMEQGSCEASHTTHTALPMQVNCDWDTVLCHTRAG